MALDKSSTLSDFLLWKVPVLKDYLRDRGLKTTGTKNELAALAYGAHELGIAKKPNHSDVQDAKKREYESLLLIGKDKIPDPVKLTDGWYGEQQGMSKWPPVFQIHIAEFLLVGEQVKTDMSKRLLSDYKEGKAYSYFTSNWLKEVFYHDITQSSKYCLLKSETTPSQSINNPPHKIWVCIEKITGNIKSAYCTCFAGLGSTCNHIAAVLFKVEYAWKNGLVIKDSPTSVECVWKSYGTKKKGQKIEPKRISELPISKPQYKKKKTVINSKEKQDFLPLSDSSHDKPSHKNIMSSLYPSLPNACGFRYVSFTNQPNFTPDDDINVEHTVEVQTSPSVPKSILDMLFTADTEEDIMTMLCNINKDEVAALEKYTQGQSNNVLWKNQRFGRITASVSHRVMTKVNTLTSAKSTVNCTSLLSTLCPDNKVCEIKNSALLYGIHMEDEARTVYVEQLKMQKHKNVRVSPCGLFVLPNMAYIGASPDGLVDCDCCGHGLLEIKCPHSVSNTTPNASNLSYLVVNGSKQTLSKSHQYYSQIQQQIGVTGRKWCDFFVYSRYGFHLERIHLDTDRWKSLKDGAEYFFRHHIAPYLIQNKENWPKP